MSYTSSPRPEPFRGTNYLTVDAFLDKLEVVSPGMAIVYATGDLAHTAPHNPDVLALRNLVWKLYEKKKVTLTQRARFDRSFISGGRAFDYIATKRSPIKIPGSKD
jgi:hypothetical protein